MSVWKKVTTVMAITLQHVQTLTEVSHVLAMKVILAMEEDAKASSLKNISMSILCNNVWTNCS